MAAPRAIVDADVLYRRHARNLLVWHAIAGLFQFHWSRRILDETRANLLANVRLASLDRAAKADQILDRVTESLDLAIAGSEVRPRRDRRDRVCDDQPSQGPACTRSRRRVSRRHRGHLQHEGLSAPCG
ncbi:MAG: hypothetical protein GXY03_05590 [Solirubrobacterales bacterium]|nr:hypothetical protein [Solirubrobacterales bacterium]